MKVQKKTDCLKVSCKNVKLYLEYFANFIITLDNLTEEAAHLSTTKKYDIRVKFQPYPFKCRQLALNLTDENIIQNALFAKTGF